MPATVLNDVVCHLRKAVLSANGAGLTDGQLLDRFVSRGEEAAFEALTRRHGPMVWGVCRRLLPHRHDAEDAFQATFLVLVRKAAGIVPREMLGSWLHGVALRTARSARKTIYRQRGREKRISDASQTTLPAPTEPRGSLTPEWDWRPLLDQELRGLPAKYRTPILLCDLGGRSRKEAARELGWTEGTLSGRLARARRLLAKRLTRRGMTLSAGALAWSLSESCALAELNPLFVATTVKACMSVANQPLIAGGIISAQVAALTQGVLRTMLMTKLKTAGAIFLAFAFVMIGAGATMWTVRNDIDSPHARIQSPRLPAPRVGEEQAGALVLNEAVKEQVVGSGKAVTKEIKVRDFTAVDIGSAFQFEITQGDTFKTTITIDDNLFDYVKAEKKDSTLKIHLDGQGHSIHTKAGMKAVISMPQLDALSLSGATHGSVKGFKSTKSFTLDVSGASSLRGALEAGKVKFQASGASKVSLEGSGTEGKVEASGASHLDLAKFSWDTLDIRLSGATHATVTVKKKLDYEVSGASRLNYRGEPEIGRSEKGGASLVHRQAK